MPRLRATVLAVLAAVVLASCGDAEPPAARVGDDAITDLQVQDTAELFRFLSAIGQQPCGQAAPGGNESEESACNRLALTNLIQFQITNGYAAANDIEVSDDEIDGAIAQLEEQLGADELATQLADNGATRQELRDLARSFSTLRLVATAVTEDELGGQALRDRYEQDIANYTTVQVDHVLVESEAEADAVYAEVTAPGTTREDFLAIARERSIDPGAAQNSGSLGSAVAGTYAPEFAEAALSLEPGEIAEPVETQFGWHVVRLEDSQVTPFAEARPRIVEQAAPEVFSTWLRDELEGSVEVNPRYGRFDLETLTVERVTSTDPDASPTESEGPVNAPASP